MKNGMKITIDISEYNIEWIRNAYSIPSEISIEIAEAIINGDRIDELIPNTPKTLDSNRQHVQDVESVEDDAVSRQAVLENVCTMLRNCFDASDEMIESVKITVGELPPSPNPSRPHDISKAKFSCPICGAEMEVTVDEWDEGGEI